MQDHLGNVRMVITTESKALIYAATMEAARSAIEDSTFSNVTSTGVTKPAGFDNTSGNLKVSKLNGNINTGGNKRTGPALILKVMAGDTVSVSSRAWYSGSVQPGATGVTPIVTELVNLLTSGILEMGGAKGGINSSAYIDGLSTTAINNLISNQGYVSTQPKAYLNWMNLDEQFALTNSSTYRGAVQVPVINAGDTAKQLVGPINWVVQKSGYLYVYVSNESNMNVYFDDIVVNHKSGPVLEVTNFRAYGSEIATLGEKAYGKTANAYRYNGKELQSKEFSDGSGIDEYDYGARHYDPLIGRWMVVDPMAETSRRWSVYNYGNCSPLNFIDPDGMRSQMIQDLNGTMHKIGDDDVETVYTAPKEDDKNSQEKGSIPVVGQAYYESPEAAAIAWGKEYNGQSIKNKKEYYSFIYSISVKMSNGKFTKYYTFTQAIKGIAHHVDFPPMLNLFKSIPKGATVEYDIHSHGEWTDNNWVEEFSKDGGDSKKTGYPIGDGGVNRWFGIGGFLASPSGMLRVLRTDVGNPAPICNCLDRDTDVYKQPTGNKIWFENFRDVNNPYNKVSTNLAPKIFTKEEIEKLKK